MLVETWVNLSVRRYIDLNMKGYPNEEALRKAHRIYLDAMRLFIIRCLKKIQGQTLEDLISDVIDYEPSKNIETAIDIGNIPLLLKNYWYHIFSTEFAEIMELPPQNDDPPHSVIFQETTFNLRANKYRVAGDAITQTFWRYWHAQGYDGKKEMEQPVLEFLADRQECRRIKIIEMLAEYFSLSEDERAILIKSGQVEKHLMNKGLIERTRTGYYRITERGLEVLTENSYDFLF